MPYVGPSVQQIQKDFDKPVKVFGIKDFGKSSATIALGIPGGDRKNYVQPATDSAIAVEKQMQASVPSENYRSQLTLFFGDDFQSCPLFTSDGSLISQDGGHLTQSGARHWAEFITPLLK